MNEDRQRDREWVQLIRGGDAAAFESLFRAYYEPLCAFIDRQVHSREVARDLAENVFVHLWTHRSTLDVRCTVRGYLYSAARLELIDYRRHGAVERNVAEHGIFPDAIPGMGEAPRSADETAQTDELRTSIQRATAELPERCRLIVMMRWEHQLSYAEIAQALSISTKTVENQMNIAFKSLRRALERFRL